MIPAVIDSPIATYRISLGRRVGKGIIKGEEMRKRRTEGARKEKEQEEEEMCAGGGKGAKQEDNEDGRERERERERKKGKRYITRGRSLSPGRDPPSFPSLSLSVRE